MALRRWKSEASAGSVEPGSDGTRRRATPPRTEARDGSGAVLSWTLTHTTPFETVTSCGASPTSTVASTRRVLRSIRETVPLRLFATQTAPSPTAIPVGRRPTRMVSVTAVLPGSTRATVSSCVLATHTAPAPVATAPGPRPTGVELVTALALAGSIRATVLSTSSVTHTPPAPVATALGLFPTGMLSTSRVRVSTRAMAP